MAYILQMIAAIYNRVICPWVTHFLSVHVLIAHLFFSLFPAGATLRISIDGCKLPTNPCLQLKSMGAIKPFSKLMGAIAPIDPT